MRHIEKALNAMKDSKVKKYITLNNIQDIKGVTPTVTFEIQSDPVGEVGVNGCQVTDMLEFVKCLFESLNNAMPNKNTEMTIAACSEAIYYQDARLRDRKERGVEGTQKK